MHHVVATLACVMTTISVMTSAVAAPFAYVADANASRVIVIDTAGPSVSGPPITVGSWPLDILINPAGTRAYVANGYGSSISVIDTASRAVIATIPDMTDVRGLAIDASGAHLFAAGLYSVYEIDTATNQVIGAPMAVAAADAASCPKVSGRPAVNPTGTQVYVPVTDCRQGPGMLSVIDVASPIAAVANIEVGGAPSSATLDVNRHRVYVTDWSGGSVSVVDTDTYEVLQTIALGASSFPTVGAMDPSGTHLYVAHNGLGNISIIDTATSVVDVGPSEMSDESFGITLTSDGTQAYVSSELGTVTVIDTATRKIVGTPLAIGGNLVSVAIGRSDALFANGFE